MLKNNQQGIVKIVPLLLIIAAVGIISFLLISSTVPFNSGFFKNIFPKNNSRAASNASISLPAASTTTQNGTLTIPIMLNTDSQDIIGADLRLNFNRFYLKLVDITIHPENSSLKTFTPTDGSGNFTKQAVIDSANATGLISFGALAFSNNTSTTFNGSLTQSNPLAELTFQGLNQGTTQIDVDFTAGSITDSNLVNPQNMDILNQVTNDQLAISGVSVGPSPTPSLTPRPTTSPTPAPTPCPKANIGDINCNGTVDITDYSTLVSHYNKQVPPGTLGDLNGNGTVDLLDYSTLVSNFNK